VFEFFELVIVVAPLWVPLWLLDEIPATSDYDLGFCFLMENFWRRFASFPQEETNGKRSPQQW
jgi:hypothetical protein